MSTVNTNPDTGVRYGTIYLNALDPELADDLFYKGENLSEKASYNDAREQALANVREEGGFDDEYEEAERRLESMDVNIEEPTIAGKYEGVSYEINWLGGAPLLWVLDSPHIGEFHLCSPCVPNACNLECPSANGYLGYDVPTDWRKS